MPVSATTLRATIVGIEPTPPGNASRIHDTAALSGFFVAITPELAPDIAGTKKKSPARGRAKCVGEEVDAHRHRADDPSGAHLSGVTGGDHAACARPRPEPVRFHVIRAIHFSLGVACTNILAPPPR